jgi:ribose transport system ATP-binding protein
VKAGGTLVTLNGVSKRYPGVVALNDVSLSLEAGTITGLAGENGAGKSTLIKVLSGAVASDEGSVELLGKPLPADPGEVIRSGISTIYQELTDVPDMSVLDNVLLAHQTCRFGLLRGRANREKARASLAMVGLGDLDLGRPARSLSPAQRQLIEIARCLARDARVLIFDEPTSSLPEQDVTNLLAIIRRLRDRGLAILYVTHHLDEMFEIADDIVVMRDGAVVTRKPAGEWTLASLVKAMLAKDLQKAYPWVERQLGERLLEVQGLTAPGVRAASLYARAGEIVGLVGLDGAGRTEFMKAVSGAVRRSQGTVTVGGRTVRSASIDAARRSGIVYAPENRKSEGLILSASITDNAILGIYARIARHGFVGSRSLDSFARARIAEYGVKAGSARQAVGTLSGGNQQKVILSRIAQNAPRVIMLDDPTRGVDVGAKSSIYEHVFRYASEGACVLLTSSDTDEVLAVADRVYVLRAGAIVREVSRPQFDREAILNAASLG